MIIPTLSVSDTNSQRRDVWLDVLRAGAFFLVLGSHLRDLSSDSETGISKFISVWKRGGWVGVDLFFVLSGYLVSGLLFAEIKKKGKADLSRFLIRRGFKIYPSFYLALAFTLVWRLTFLDDSLSKVRLTGEILFLQNYLGMYWQHHWSLAVEEHFYLLLASGVCLTQYLRHNQITLAAFRLLPGIWVAVASACLVLRLRMSLTLPFDVHTHLIHTHLRIDSLLTGALLAWLMHHHFPLFSPQLQTRLILLLTGLTLFVPPFIWDFTQVWWVLPWGALLHAAGASMIILAGFARQKPATMIEKILAFIGYRSYNIYLWHLPWLFWLNPALCRQLGIQESWMLCAISYLAGSVLLGTLLTATVEKPFLRLRDWLFPPHATPLPATI